MRITTVIGLQTNLEIKSGRCNTLLNI